MMIKNLVSCFSTIFVEQYIFIQLLRFCLNKSHCITDSSNVPGNEDEATDEEGKREIVNISQWTKECAVTATFPCQEFKVNNMFYDRFVI